MKADGSGVGVETQMKRNKAYGWDSGQFHHLPLYVKINKPEAVKPLVKLISLLKIMMFVFLHLYFPFLTI